MDIQDYFIQANLGYQKNIPFEVNKVTFKKGTRTIDIGQIEHSLYFLVSGKTETYMQTPKAERIMEFFFPGELFSSLTSLIHQKPSDVYNLCVSKCVMQVIPYASLQEACRSSIFANSFFNHYVVQAYIKRVKKEKDTLTKDPEQRYIELLKSRPYIFQEIPMAHIAMYLGIHPNSLGRIRKRLIHEEKQQL